MSPTEFCNLTNPCREVCEWAVANCRDMDEAWATARPGWLVWIATRPGVLHNRTLRRFAAWSARQVQHLMTDPRSLAVLDVAERYADGQAAFDELEAARAAARAAWAAANAARYAAGGNAPLAACNAAEAMEAQDAAFSARYAEEAAAWSARASIRGAAAWSARYAAEVAARNAAQSAQAEWLRANATPDWERARQMGGAR